MESRLIVHGCNHIDQLVHIQEIKATSGPLKTNCTSMAVFLLGDLHFHYLFLSSTTSRSLNVDFSKHMTTLVYFSTFPMHCVTLKEIYNIEAECY
jgi:hypothetical protein